MLVRTNSILLFSSSFPAQPIEVLNDNDSQIDQVTPNSTAQSANTSVYSSEYGIVTDITSTTLNLSSSILSQHQDIIATAIETAANTDSTETTKTTANTETAENTETTANTETVTTIETTVNTKTTTEDAIDSLSACLHLNTAVNDIIEQEISLFNFTTDETSLLMNNPIPTYYKPSAKENTNIIYYKRREDYYPQLQSKVPSIIDRHHVNVLGTRINSHPTLDDSNGMPVFKPSNDSSKPKAMLKRLKTMVKSKKVPYIL